MAYRLVCFDAGFTLLQPRRSMAELLGGVLAAEGVPATEEALHRAWQVADEWFWEEYRRPDNATWTSDERISATWREYHRLMLRELGVDDPEHHIVDAVLDAQLAVDGWQLYADVQPALDALAGRARMGVVSDWSAELPEILSAVGLIDRFDFILVSATVGAAKPAAELFRMAADRAGVSTGEALMVGDSYEADVGGARAAGMDAVLLDRDGTATVADVPVIRSLVELPQLVTGGAGRLASR